MSSCASERSEHGRQSMPPPLSTAIAPAERTPVRAKQKIGRTKHSEHAPGNPHIRTPPNETQSSKKKRQSRIRAYDSRYYGQSKFDRVFTHFLFSFYFCFRCRRDERHGLIGVNCHAATRFEHRSPTTIHKKPSKLMILIATNCVE